MGKLPAALFWSGGKDAALSFQKILQGKDYEVKVLISTTTEKDTIAMHGVPVSIIRAQANEMGLPLLEMKLPEFSSNQLYEKAFSEICEKAKKEYSIEYLVFGDIYLEGIRDFRMQLAEGNQLKAHFPLWGISTKSLFESFLKAGFKAKTIVIDASKLDESWLGRDLDESFQKEYPDTCDICGEDGAYHSLVYDAPYFKKEIPLPEKTQRIKKELQYGNSKQLFYYLKFLA